MFVSLAITFLSSSTMSQVNMTDEPQPTWPESELDASLDTGISTQALNDYAAIHQKLVSQDTLAVYPQVTHPRLLVFKKSTLPDIPGYSTQGLSQDPSPVASTSANPHVYGNPEKKSSATKSAKPLAPLRRQPVFSEQPSISGLSELGVKVRDFAYESTLPPVPTVYLQPRQIQPSFPRDPNDPNDLHYVLEEERKKKAYSFESTRKIQRTPTEPMLESECVPPERCAFPKIKRANALLDLSSQFDSQSQSQPSYPISYDATDTPQSASQPVELLVDTSIVPSNRFVQWQGNPALTISTAVSTTQKAISSVDPSSSMNSITVPSEFVCQDSQLTAVAISPISQSRDTNYPAIRGSLKHISESDDALIIPTSLPRVLCPVSPARLTLQLHSSELPSHPPLSPSVLSSASIPPRYNLRKNKRRAESPLPVSPDRHLSSRQWLMCSSMGSGTTIEGTTHVVSTNFAHLQKNTNFNVNATGRALRRSKDGIHWGNKPSKRQRQ